MKLQITAGEMLKALNIVNHVRAGRTPVPILECVLLRVKSGELILSRSNLNLAITTSIAVDSKVDGAVCAPAISLTQLFSRLSAEHLVHLEASENQLTLKSASGEYRFATIPADEFPRIRNHECEGECALNPDHFIMVVNRTAFCASTDISRPALNGVYWRLGDKMLVAATDAHRLAWNETEIKSVERAEVIVPPDALSSVASIAKNASEFFVTFGDKHVTFRSDETEIASVLIEGPYPNITHVIPTDFKTVVLIDRQELIDALDRLEIAANEFTHSVRFEISEGRLVLSAEKADSGRHATESLDCELTGQSIEIGFNLLYVLEIVKRIETQKVRIEMIRSLSAALFKPINISEYFYLLMPLKIEQNA